MVLQIGFEEFGERRMQILGKPRLGLCALQVAASLVDSQRRIPGDAGFNHAIEDFGEFLPIGFPPQAACMAKAIRLIGVVIT